MRHYAHNIGDYAAATVHLTWLEDCAYRRLLDLYYQTERPLPNDLDDIARRVRAVSRWEKAALRRVLTEFFFKNDDGCWHQRRADKELSAFKRMAEGGRIGGLKAQAKGRTKPTLRPTVQPTTTHYPLEEERVERKSDSLPARARSDRDDPGIEQFVPEARDAPDPATKPAFLRRHLTQQAIPPNWRPSTMAIQRLRASRPDMTDAQIAEETERFLSWCAETNKTSFSAEDTWLNFMRKTHVKPASDDDPDDSPAARGIAAAFARRFPDG